MLGTKIAYRYGVESLIVSTAGDGVGLLDRHCHEVGYG